MSPLWAKVHKILGKRDWGGKTSFVPTHPKHKIRGIKSKGLRYGLEHREKEAQLLSLSNHDAADYGKEEDKLGKVALFYLGGYNLTLPI